jgi:hypothetical protein
VPQTTAEFVIESQEPLASAFTSEAGVDYGLLRLSKGFTGGIEATSTVEMLFTRTPREDGSFGGAGYVALERITGTVDGRSGSFALLHISTVDDGQSQWSRWPISPGSGTGELAGITGTGRIDIAEDGSHTLLLDYELG